MNQRQTVPRTLRLRWWVALGLMVALVPVSTALAQDEGARRELEAARERIHTMMREAEELHEAGRLNAAERMQQKAHQLEERIEQRLDRHQRARTADAEHLHNVLEGLERGMAALRELGRHEELEALERVAHDVRQELQGRREGSQRERQGAHRSENEREVAQHQLEIMRMAMPALREGERRDAAELLEHAIHAQELGLEGRTSLADRCPGGSPFSRRCRRARSSSAARPPSSETWCCRCKKSNTAAVRSESCRR